MQTPAIRLILEEYAAMATVLRALRATVQSAERPDFDDLRAMLFYLDDVPMRAHHADESELLFPRIRERCPALRPVLDRLEAEHERNESAVRDLEHALMAWQLMGDSRREAFRALAHVFATAALGHLEVAKNYVLSVAGDFLSASDWHDMDEGLRRRRSALAEHTARGHRELYSRIIARHPPASRQP
jgi:hemerythrin-like domain-containing protein